MDYKRCLEFHLLYLGPVKGVYTDWTPLTDRPGLFQEDLDMKDHWQFKNIAQAHDRHPHFLSRNSPILPAMPLKTSASCSELSA